MTAPAEIQMPSTVTHRAFCVVDLDPCPGSTPAIQALAALRISGTIPATPQDMRTWLINPDTAPTSTVNGLPNSGPQEGLPWEQVRPALTAAIESRIFVAHDAPTVRAALVRGLPDLRFPLVLDTRQMAAALWPDLPRYDLDHLHFPPTTRQSVWRYPAAARAWKIAGLLAKFLHWHGWEAVRDAGGVAHGLPAPLA